MPHTDLEDLSTFGMKVPHSIDVNAAVKTFPSQGPSELSNALHSQLFPELFANEENVECDYDIGQTQNYGKVYECLQL